MTNGIGIRLALLVLGFSAALSAAGEVPVVVAVDTSRSLSSADIQTLRSDLGRTLELLPAQAPLGLVAFDDEARWLVQPGGSREQLLSALDHLQPEGRFTVLHDALFLAARELSRGGVVLVVTDGKDEGSATTAEDVARVSELHHVRVVAASLGRKVDERALRRLALITRGELVGGLTRETPEAVARAVEAARASVTAELAALAPPAAPAAAAPASPPVASPRAGSRLPGWLLPVLAFLAIGLAVAIWLGLRGRRSETHLCEQCGAPLEPWETHCPHCQIAELEAAARSQQVAPPVPSDQELLDPEVFKKAPLPPGLEELEHTLVLDEQPVLVARQRGRSMRSYILPRDQIFAVGRAPGVNSLQVDDPTVSAQHFRVVPKEGEFFVVDLDTTNGTMVNHERVKVRKLASGDVIQVGGVQLEFSLQLKRVS
jgi:hypothetical protein